MTTVRQAAQTILLFCDGASTEDGQGYNKFDARFARDLLSQPEWTRRQEEAVRQMLRKYRGQLSGQGIDWDSLEMVTPSRSERLEAEAKEERGRLDADNRGRLLFYTTFAIRDMAKAVPGGRWMAEEKAWRYLPKPEAVVKLHDYIKEGRIDSTPKAQKIIDRVMVAVLKEQKDLQDLQDRVAQVQQVKVSEQEFEVPLRSTPRDYQYKGIKIGNILDHSAQLMEQGTGKTLVAVAVAGQRYLRGEIKKVLVVAPTSVLYEWQKEFHKHSDFTHKVVPLADMKVKDRKKVLENWDYSAGLSVVTVNYESTWRMEDEILSWGPDMVILDESQKIKDGTTNQAKACHKFGAAAKYRMILTGTPITQNPLDLWSQYKFLDPRIFPISYARFRDRYAVMGGFGGYQVLGFRVGEFLRNGQPNRYYDPELSQEFMDKVHSIAFRVTKAEAGELPETTDQFLYCDLKDQSLRAYRQMEKEFTVTLGEGEVSAPIVLTQMLRLQQITGGFVPQEDGTIHSIGREKLNVLKEFVEDFPAHKKLVIFARFRPELEAISEVLRSLGRNPEILAGGTKNRGELIRRFQEEDEITDFVVQVQTGGVGITLTRADTAIIYSSTFSYADYEQMKARIHRIGQTNKVTYIHILARGTIDEDVMDAILTKRDIAETVIDKYRGGEKVNSPELEKALMDLRDELDGMEDVDEEEEVETEEKEQATNKKLDGGKGRRRRRRKEEEEEKTPTAKPKADPPPNTDGGETLTVKDLAEELGISPTVLRRKLRNSGLDKPGGRWEWPANHQDLATIRAWD